MYVFKSSGRQSGLDYLDPSVHTVYVFPDFLPFENPCPVNSVSGLRSWHSPEAVQIVPSFEFLQLCLIDFLLVLSNLLLSNYRNLA